MRSPQRKASGYRIFGDEDLKRLLFIRQAKVLGFSLDDIREILAAKGKGQCPCGTVIGIAERHLRETEQQIRNLTAFRDELRRSVSIWKQEGQQQVSADAICIRNKSSSTNATLQRTRPLFRNCSGSDS
jgi:DNA-binding transcriptional MerR regulator